MKKMINKVIIVIFLISLTIIPAHAQDSYIYSVRAQKGTSSHNLNDYSDAEAIPITGNSLVKEMYVKNSESNLYIGFRTEVNTSLHGLALVFDVDHDQQFAEDVKILNANQTKEDGYFYQNSALSLQSSSYFDGGIYPISYIDGKTYNLYEFSIPFNPNSNPTMDMYISDPSDYMLGFDFITILNNSLISWSRGVLPSEHTIQQLDANASSFYTMVLAGPGKYAVPDFNPVVTTSPTQTYYQNQTSATSSNAAYNKQAMTTAATPGFEMYLFIIAIITVIIIRKFKLRRIN